MGQLTITFTPEQMKAMEYVAISPLEWIQNAWDNRARQAIDQIVEEQSNIQPRKLKPEQKHKFIRSAELETAREREARFERERSEGRR